MMRFTERHTFSEPANAVTVKDGKQDPLEAMCRDWPFFSSRLSMLEMVFAKANLPLEEYYDPHLMADLP